MRKFRWFTMCVMTAALLTACSNGSSSGTGASTAPETDASTGTETDMSSEIETGEPTEAETTTPTEAKTDAPTTEAEGAVSAYPLRQSGNSNTIELYEIAEEGADTFNAWLKVATQYDPDLTVYASDSMQDDTIAIAVTFEVSNFDGEEATLYWCYELDSNGETISVWDQSSPAETLTITEDGTYTMVFNANKALGGAIERIGSL